MKIEDFNLDSKDQNSLRERLKDVKNSSPTTMHPMDHYLVKMGLVVIKDGLTTYIGNN